MERNTKKLPGGGPGVVMRSVFLSALAAVLVVQPSHADTEKFLIHGNRLDAEPVTVTQLLNNPIEEASAETDGRAESIRTYYGSFYADKGADVIAREFLALLDTVQTSILMTSTYHEIGILADDATQIMHLEDGSVIRQSSSDALLESSIAQDVAAGQLAARDRASFGAGEVQVGIAGACPFMPGPAELVPLGLAFEVRRDEQSMLFCVPGLSRVYCIASEPTVISLTVEEDKSDIAFGYGTRGLQCELYEGGASFPVTLEGSNWRDCRIELARN